MNDTAETILKILELRKQGKTAAQIADIFEESGIRPPTGLKYTQSMIYTAVAQHKARQIKKGELLPLPPKKIKTPVMETIQVRDEPPSESNSKKGKVIAIIADAEDVSDFLKKWVNHG